MNHHCHSCIKSGYTWDWTTDLSLIKTPLYRWAIHPKTWYPEMESNHHLSVISRLYRSLYYPGIALNLGWQGWARTSDMVINSHPLYQLSYMPIKILDYLVLGIEPSSPAQGVLSNELYQHQAISTWQGLRSLRSSLSFGGLPSTKLKTLILKLPRYLHPITESNGSLELRRLWARSPR